MADTLLDVATEEVQKAKDEQARVGAELIEAQKDLDEAQKGLDGANDELKTLNEEAAAIRRQIAEETVSADGAKLFEDLDAKTTERRAKEAEIIAHARARLAHYKCPRSVEFVDELPLSVSKGDVERHKLVALGKGAAWDREAAGYQIRLTR